MRVLGLGVTGHRRPRTQRRRYLLTHSLELGCHFQGHNVTLTRIIVDIAPPVLLRCLKFRFIYLKI